MLNSLLDFFDYVVMNRGQDQLDRLIQSPAEEAFWRAAKRIMPELVPQEKVRGYSIDFAIPHIQFGIEIYGYQYHSSMVEMENDNLRLRRLGLSGWFVWVFMANEVFADPHGCASQAARLAEMVSRLR